jgi:glycerol-3-phosphate dehydrogenase (NAD(P)+)
MAIITVLGAGMMGSALAVPLADRGHDVRLVGTHLDDAIIEGLRKDGVHLTLRHPLPAGIRFFTSGELAAAMEGCEALALGVSSAGIDWAGETIAPFARADLPVFMITKGLRWNGSSLDVLPDVLRAAIGGVVHPAAVAGPCIAGELARRVPSCVVVAGRAGAMLGRIAELIRTDYYHVWTTTDVVGAETGAALKNAYAMGVAFGAGLHERRGGAPGSVAMHNLESAVFAQAVYEMQLIAAHLGAEPDTIAGLAGVGDLDVTNNGGRTGRFGRLLGLGRTVPEARAEMQGATLECLEIIAVMREATTRWCGSGELAELPLFDHMADVALDGKAVDPPLARFFGGEHG